MEAEDRANKARRLRYKTSTKEVEMHTIADEHFHTFLSHVWRQAPGFQHGSLEEKRNHLLAELTLLLDDCSMGQDQMRIVKQRLVEMLPFIRVFLDVDECASTVETERTTDALAR